MGPPMVHHLSLGMAAALLILLSHTDIKQSYGILYSAKLLHGTSKVIKLLRSPGGASQRESWSWSWSWREDEVDFLTHS